MLSWACVPFQMNLLMFKISKKINLSLTNSATDRQAFCFSARGAAVICNVKAQNAFNMNR